MKLFDGTVNPQLASGTKKPSFVSLTIYGNTQSEIPQATKMGTILRIHRGQTKKYHQGYQLNCDVNIKAAWALFDPAEGYIPTNHTGRSYTFVDDDKKRLKEIRKDAADVLKNCDVTASSSIGAKKNEVDMICMVLSRKEKSKTTDQLLVTDGNDFFKVELPHDHFSYAGPQEIVRMRGMTERKGKLTFNDYTNVIKLEKTYSAAEELVNKITGKKDDKDFRDKIDMHIPFFDPSPVASEVLVSKAESTTLKDLFATDPKDLNKNKFKVTVSVLEIGPKDPCSWIVDLDTKARKQ